MIQQHKPRAEELLINSIYSVSDYQEMEEAKKISTFF